MVKGTAPSVILLGMDRKKLTSEEIEAQLAKLVGWSVRGDKIAKHFTFDSYASGCVFANAVGCVADAIDHHPDILIGYRKVDVSVNSHDVGGISAWDFELAARIDALRKTA